MSPFPFPSSYLAGIEPLKQLPFTPSWEGLGLTVDALLPVRYCFVLRLLSTQHLAPCFLYFCFLFFTTVNSTALSTHIKWCGSPVPPPVQLSSSSWWTVRTPPSPPPSSHLISSQPRLPAPAPPAQALPILSGAASTSSKIFLSKFSSDRAGRCWWENHLQGFAALTLAFTLTLTPTFLEASSLPPLSFHWGFSLQPDSPFRSLGSVYHSSIAAADACSSSEVEISSTPATQAQETPSEK